MKSPPARGRGLKHPLGRASLGAEEVAPRAGAWIETSVRTRRPSGASVAPRAGAWIETIVPRVVTAPLGVAPRAGAWIETAM